MRKLSAVALLLFLCSASAAGAARDYAYALVQGRLHSAGQPAPLAGARVLLTAANRTLEATSDARGVFVFDKVPLDNYTLWVTAADGTAMQAAQHAGEPLVGIRLRAHRGTVEPIRVEATADGVRFDIPRPETNWRRLWAEIGIFVAGAAALAL